MTHVQFVVHFSKVMFFRPANFDKHKCNLMTKHLSQSISFYSKNVNSNNADKNFKGLNYSLAPFCKWSSLEKFY